MAVYEDLERLYAWIDEIPLSRFKKNLPRDFSDGGKCLIMHFLGYIRYSQLGMSLAYSRYSLFNRY